MNATRAAANPTQGTGRRTAAVLLGVFASVLFLRRPDALLHPQFWAEDGMFYVQALVEPWASLAAPYNGYLHAGPRLVALLASWFDPLFAPAIFAWSALTLTLVVLARVMSPRVRLPHAPWLALVVVLIPDVREVLVNVTNLQWLLAIGQVALLVSDDASSVWEHAGDVSFALLAGLSGPFSLLFAPLFVVRAGQRRTRSAIAVMAVVLASAVIQAWFVLHFTEQPVDNPTPFSWLRVPEILGLWLGGVSFGGALVPKHPPSGALIGAGLAITALVAVLALRRGPRRNENLFLAASLGLLLAAALYRLRREQHLFLIADIGQRYFFVPQVLVLWLLIGAWEWTRVRFLAIGLCAAFLITNLPRFRFAPFEDVDWPRYADRIREGYACVFPVNPPGFTISSPQRALDLTASAANLAPAYPEASATVRFVFPTGGKPGGVRSLAPARARTWCSLGESDATTGSLVIGPFPSAGNLRFAVCGYPHEPGNHLFVEHFVTHERLDVRPPNPGERWRLVDIALPAAWRGQPVVLVVIDGATTPNSWVAVSEPLQAPAPPR